MYCDIKLLSHINPTIKSEGTLPTHLVQALVIEFYAAIPLFRP